MTTAEILLVYGMVPPARIPREWSPCSVGLDGAAEWFSRWGSPKHWGGPARVVLWSDDKTERLFVADYPNGCRLERWQNKRGWRTVFTRTPQP